MILSLETSTLSCSVALHRDGELIALREEAGKGYIHSEKLHLFIEEVFRQSSTQFTDLQAVAVGKGPGSYTGLRIGVSAAKGIAYALNLPLIAVNGLENLVHSYPRQLDAQSLLVPMLDARRMEVYTAVYNAAFQPDGPVQALILDEAAFSEYAEKKLILLGDGREKALQLGRENWHDGGISYPNAKTLGAIATEKYARSEFEDLAYFEPFYLKDFKAGKPKKLL